MQRSCQVFVVNAENDATNTHRMRVVRPSSCPSVETAAGVNENVTKSDAALAAVASDLWKLQTVAAVAVVICVCESRVWVCWQARLEFLEGPEHPGVCGSVRSLDEVHHIGRA